MFSFYYIKFSFLCSDIFLTLSIITFACSGFYRHGFLFSLSVYICVLLLLFNLVLLELRGRGTIICLNDVLFLIMMRILDMKSILLINFEVHNAVLLTIETMLYSRFFPTYSSCLVKTLYLLTAIPHLPLHTAPGNHHSTLFPACDGLIYLA